MPDARLQRTREAYRKPFVCEPPLISDALVLINGELVREPQRYLIDGTICPNSSKRNSKLNIPAAVYGTLNAIGAMRGNKETPKGAAMEKKHDAKVSGQHPHANLGKYLHAPKRGK